MTRSRRLSGPTAVYAVSDAAITVSGMTLDDTVEPGDAALQALLAGLAEKTDDDEKRTLLLDLILTVPPLRQWPTDSLLRLENITRSVGGQLS